CSEELPKGGLRWEKKVGRLGPELRPDRAARCGLTGLSRFRCPSRLPQWHCLRKSRLWPDLRNEIAVSFSQVPLPLRVDLGARLASSPCPYPKESDSARQAQTRLRLEVRKTCQQFVFSLAGLLYVPILKTAPPI